MARKLTAGVVLRHPGSGAPTFLPEGSDIPEWAAEMVGDHLLEGSADTSTEATEQDPPPKAGRGSSRDAWAEYAHANSVAHEDDATRDDIIDACDAAGVPTE